MRRAVAALATAGALLLATACGQRPGVIAEIVPDPRREGGELAKVIERTYGFLGQDEDYSMRVLPSGHSCAVGELYEVCR